MSSAWWLPADETTSRCLTSAAKANLSPSHGGDASIIAAGDANDLIAYLDRMNTATTTKNQSLSGFAVGLGLAGLLPIPGIVASIAAIICGRGALREEPEASGRARLGITLGIIGLVAPLVILFVYCVLLGYPFPIHRYRAD